MKPRAAAGGCPSIVDAAGRSAAADAGASGLLRVLGRVGTRHTPRGDGEIAEFAVGVKNVGTREPATPDTC